MMKTPISTADKIADLESKRIHLLAKRKKAMPWMIGIPFFVSLMSLVVLGVPQLIFFISVASVLFSVMFNHWKFGSPFGRLKFKVKEALLFRFINAFHPDVKYLYEPKKKEGKYIIRESDLISADIYEEEDVIDGVYKGVDFYLSEIHLKNKSKKSSYTVFDGMLFKIRVTGQSFPSAQIKSQQGLLSRIFGGFKKHEAYGFYYDTNDETRFLDQLDALFPFIKYLSDKQGDIRIKTKGNEIIIMMESEIDFLDDPNPAIASSFINQEYESKLTQQLNSFLFIIKSFAGGSATTEIKEQLKLKAIEFAEIKRNA